MRLWHTAAATSAQFDDPNLVSHAGLVPVMRLAQDCGLAELVGERVTVAGPCGANTPHKIGCVVAGMIAGADAIDDLDLLRCGGMGELFDGVRAPSTLGSFLRALSWGNARQLEGEPAAAGRARRPGPGPARRGRPDVAGCGLVSAAGVRARQAGRRVRPRQGRRVLGAAARAEPADRGDLHPDQRTAGGRDPTARRHRRLGPRRGLVRGRSDRHRPGRRRTGCSWCGWTRRSTTPPPSPRAAGAGPSGHRPDGPQDPPHHRADPRPGLDGYPLSAGDLGSTTSNGGSPTPRSPRSTTPRSRPGVSRRSPRS